MTLYSMAHPQQLLLKLHTLLCCRCIYNGEAVPDKLIGQLLAQSIAALPANKHVLLDGIPCNVSQALAMDEHLSIDVVLHIDVPLMTCLGRFSNR
jgi:adenylate kinase family enzyme